MKILITGATSGIGEATARVLDKLGHELILTGRRQDRLLKLQKDLKRAQVAAFDISKKSEVLEFAKNFQSHLVHLDVLINNAGLARGSEKMDQASLDHWETMMQTNVMGLLYLTRQVLPHLVSRGSGHIVNMGSVAGRWVYPGGAVYCATKFAVRALSEGLRMDLLGKNIRVSNIEPGMVQTEFSKVRFEDEAKAQAVYAGMKPLTAEDIAETISWVIGRPPHVNIQELVIYPTDQASVQMVHRI